MTQQINLYPAALQQVHVPYGGRTMVRVVAIVSGLLALGAVALFADSLRLAGEVRELQQRQEAAVRHLAEEQRRLPPRARDPRLEAEIVQLQSARDQRQPLGGQLAMLTAAPPPAFSSALAGLARQTPDGVWLRRVVLSASDRSLQLDGSSVQAEAPLQLVESLTREAAFAGMRFGHLQLTRTGEEEGGAIDFSLATAGGQP